jgi:hypothetical protein
LSKLGESSADFGEKKFPPLLVLASSPVGKIISLTSRRRTQSQEKARFCQVTESGKVIAVRNFDRVVRGVGWG